MILERSHIGIIKMLGSGMPVVVVISAPGFPCPELPAEFLPGGVSHDPLAERRPVELFAVEKNQGPKPKLYSLDSACSDYDCPPKWWSIGDDQRRSTMECGA